MVPSRCIPPSLVPPSRCDEAAGTEGRVLPVSPPCHRSADAADPSRCAGRAEPLSPRRPVSPSPKPPKVRGARAGGKRLGTREPGFTAIATRALRSLQPKSRNFGGEDMNHCRRCSAAAPQAERSPWQRPRPAGPGRAGPRRDRSTWARLPGSEEPLGTAPGV